MIKIIAAILFFAFSSLIMFLMAAETNKRLHSIQTDSNNDLIIVQPYKIDATSLILSCFVLLLSILCGYLIAEHATSTLAIIQLGICYLATLASAIIDVKTKTIPNIIPIVVVCLRTIIFIYEIIYTTTALSYLISSLIGCFLCAVMLIIANKISKGGIGGGDIKLLSSMGLMCGIYVVFSTLLLSLIACILISVVLILLKKKNSKDHLPFGPFVYLGFVIMCLFTLY